MWLAIFRAGVVMPRTDKYHGHTSGCFTWYENMTDGTEFEDLAEAQEVRSTVGGTILEQREFHPRKD